MTSRRLVGLGGLALAAADRSHGRQASLLDPWRLPTPQIHPTKLGFDTDQWELCRTSPSSRHTVRANAPPSRAQAQAGCLLAVTVHKLSIVSTQRYTVQLQSSTSYTRQSADLLRQPIELETLDILTTVHDTIADCVDLHKGN